FLGEIVPGVVIFESHGGSNRGVGARVVAHVLDHHVLRLTDGTRNIDNYRDDCIFQWLGNFAVLWLRVVVVDIRLACIKQIDLLNRGSKYRGEGNAESVAQIVPKFWFVWREHKRLL